MAPPEILQCWNDFKVLPLPRGAFAPWYLSPPQVGVVIGTYAAVPYIHLQLEARRRFYPHVPLLVHDDASNRRNDLERLCASYGCDFEVNTERQPPCVGDLTAFAGGLLWARKRGVCLLLKLSRRWIFKTDWSKSLAELALASQYATIGSYTTSFNFGFRTECLALSVDAWTQPAVFREICGPIHRRESVFVEGYLHNVARQLETLNGTAATHWQECHPMTSDKNGYALWTLMGTDRRARSDDYLWHDSATPVDYFRLARDWSLPYAESDFVDPNQGEGDRPQFPV